MTASTPLAVFNLKTFGMIPSIWLRQSSPRAANGLREVTADQKHIAGRSLVKLAPNQYGSIF